MTIQVSLQKNPKNSTSGEVGVFPLIVETLILLFEPYTSLLLSWVPNTETSRRSQSAGYQSAAKETV